MTGGRSSGARVACRTAARTGSIGVLCLAFPLQPPARAGATTRAPSRQPELDGSGVPVLVLQGRNDRFGMPRSSRALRREVVRVDGDHGLKRDHPAIAAAITRWLGALWPGPEPSRQLELRTDLGRLGRPVAQHGPEDPVDERRRA